MGRGQLWWAYGQLEAMRLLCLNLARLTQNFADTQVGDEPYFKVEQALSRRAASLFEGNLLSNGAKGNVPGHSRHSQLLPGTGPAAGEEARIDVPGRARSANGRAARDFEPYGVRRMKSGSGQMMYISSMMFVSG